MQESDLFISDENIIIFWFKKKNFTYTFVCIILYIDLELIGIMNSPSWKKYDSGNNDLKQLK